MNEDLTPKSTVGYICERMTEPQAPLLNPPTEPIQAGSAARQNWLYYAGVALLVVGLLEIGSEVLDLISAFGAEYYYQVGSGWESHDRENPFSLKDIPALLGAASTVVAGFGLLRRFWWAVPAMVTVAVLGLVTAAIGPVQMLVHFADSDSDFRTNAIGLAMFLVNGGLSVIPHLVLPMLILAWIRRGRRDSYLSTWCSRSGPFALGREILAARREQIGYEAATAIVCHNCQYPLWHLPGRSCPECGMAFKIGDYAFVPGSVRFCCPHCDQSYYGTDQQGQLSPRNFTCIKCAQHLDTEQMVIRPLDGNVPVQSERTPWLDRKSVGRFRAWYRTFKLSLFNPARLAAGLTGQHSPGSAWWFVCGQAILSILFALIPAGLMLLFIGAQGLSGWALRFSFIFLLAPPMLVIVSVLLCGLWTHLALLITGRHRPTLAGTFESIRYASGPLALVALDQQSHTSFLWFTLSAVFILRQTHRLTFTRAVGAVLGPPMLIVLLFTLLTVGLKPILSSRVKPGSGNPVSQSSSSFNTSSSRSINVSQQEDLIAAIKEYAKAHDDRGPANAAMLWGDPIDGTTFVAKNSQTVLDRIPLGTSTMLDYVENHGSPEQLAALMPPNLIAHRVGDYVFTYHGANLSTANPKFWLFVSCRDPDQNPIEDYVWATSIDRSSTSSSDFDSMLSEQNRLRAAEGLPPLPDVRKLTHAKPAVADGRAP